MTQYFRAASTISFESNLEDTVSQETHQLDFTCVIKRDETGFEESEQGRYEINGMEIEPDTLRELFGNETMDFVFSELHRNIKLEQFNPRNPDNV